MEITDEMLQPKKIQVSERYSGGTTLSELVKEYGPDAMLECEDQGSYGDTDWCVVISYERLETKKEIDNRIKRAIDNEKRMIEYEKYERQKYEELKKKYG